MSGQIKQDSYVIGMYDSGIGPDAAIDSRVEGGRTLKAACCQQYSF